jgi:hypothetical protein
MGGVSDKAKGTWDWATGWTDPSVKKSSAHKKAEKREESALAPPDEFSAFLREMSRQRMDASLRSSKRSSFLGLAPTLDRGR